jgi:hypothetical protein
MVIMLLLRNILCSFVEWKLDFTRLDKDGFESYFMDRAIVPFDEIMLVLVLFTFRTSFIYYPFVKSEHVCTLFYVNEHVFTLQNVRKKRKGTYVFEIMALSFRPFFVTENVYKRKERELMIRCRNYVAIA